jgi:hypothetical protein
MDQRATQAELLPHPARQLLGGPVCELRKRRAVQELVDAPVALLLRLAK